jgi:hypothetical protein
MTFRAETPGIARSLAAAVVAFWREQLANAMPSLRCRD